jgi:ketosteroid isomerase-like protein
MLNRQEALEALGGAYRARVSGDRDALARYWADGAHFEIVGKPDRMAGVPLKSAGAMQTIGALIDQFGFSDHQILDAVLEGSKLAARSRVTVTVSGKPPETTDLFDLVEFDADGKISSFVQFADTALIRDMAE